MYKHKKNTYGNHDEDENTETLYDVTVGNDTPLYEAGGTRRNISSLTEEAPNLDAAKAVYDTQTMVVHLETVRCG